MDVGSISGMTPKRQAAISCAKRHSFATGLLQMDQPAQVEMLASRLRLVGIHLYVSLACSWAHRTLIFRELKGLEKMISVSVVHWYMADKGWTFETGDGAVPDTVNGSNYIYEVYTKAMSDYSGRVTVPVLWDKQNNTIVSNESSEIIRMFNSAFDGIGATAGDYYPEPK